MPTPVHPPPQHVGARQESSPRPGGRLISAHQGRASPASRETHKRSVNVWIFAVSWSWSLSFVWGLLSAHARPLKIDLHPSILCERLLLSPGRLESPLDRCCCTRYVGVYVGVYARLARFIIVGHDFSLELSRGASAYYYYLLLCTERSGAIVKTMILQLGQRFPRSVPCDPSPK